jgi:SAM-dependent methyltransferase
MSPISIARRVGRRVLPPPDSLSAFHSRGYLRHNARRQEHLASLSIRVEGASVLEVGAGIGDHTHYFLDRGCHVTITEAREENLRLLRKRYAGADIRALDLEDPDPLEGAPFEVVYCYGTLYHLSNPVPAIEFLSDNCSRTLLLETCVSFGDGLSVNQTSERQGDPSQALSGMGCRPTRPWVMLELQKHFEYVYVPATQPNHEEFPIDWTQPSTHAAALSRAVFVASRASIENSDLITELPSRQRRQL